MITTPLIRLKNYLKITALNKLNTIKVNMKSPPFSLKIFLSFNDYSDDYCNGLDT